MVPNTWRRTIGVLAIAAFCAAGVVLAETVTGLTNSGSAIPTPVKPVLFGASDGTNAQVVKATTSGVLRSIPSTPTGGDLADANGMKVQGPIGDAGAVTGNPVLIAGKYQTGGQTLTLRTNSSGELIASGPIVNGGALVPGSSIPLIIGGTNGTTVQTACFGNSGQLIIGGIDSGGGLRAVDVSASRAMAVAGLDAGGGSRALPCSTLGIGPPSVALITGGIDTAGAARQTYVDTTGRAITVGAAANGAAAAGNPHLMGGMSGDSNARTLGAIVPGSVLSSSLYGMVVNSVDCDTPKTTYIAATQFSPTATSATDVFTITGSGTKTILVRRLKVTGTATAATNAIVQLIKRSTADTSGTPATVTSVPLDSSNAAATATVQSWTANPTTGTLVGTVGVAYVFLPASGTVVYQTGQEWVFSTRKDQGLTLRGTGQVLALSLSGVSIAGVALSCEVEYTEE